MVDSGVEEVGQLLDQVVRVVLQTVVLCGHDQIFRIDVLRVKLLDPIDYDAGLLQQELLLLLLLSLRLKLHVHALFS